MGQPCTIFVQRRVGRRWQAGRDLSQSKQRHTIPTACAICDCCHPAARGPKTRPARNCSRSVSPGGRRAAVRLYVRGCERARGSTQPMRSAEPLSRPETPASPFTARQHITSCTTSLAGSAGRGTAHHALHPGARSVGKDNARTRPSCTRYEGCSETDPPARGYGRGVYVRPY